MFFEKKKEKSKKCEGCGYKTYEKYSFCPHCGNSFEPKKEQKNFGMLGRNDNPDLQQDTSSQGFGITDKLISSIMNSMMKS
ncbi:MAG: hypothetical protein R6U35_08195, partial [Candidatus Humimicrobiaceae bacterium]